MRKFLTTAQKIELFDDILDNYVKDEESIGDYIKTTFDSLNLKERHESYINSFTKDEQDIIDAINKGMIICHLDGILYCRSDNSNLGVKTQFSMRAWNKLKEKGLYKGYPLRMYPNY